MPLLLTGYIVALRVRSSRYSTTGVGARWQLGFKDDLYIMFCFAVQLRDVLLLNVIARYTLLQRINNVRAYWQLRGRAKRPENVSEFVPRLLAFSLRQSTAPD